MAADMVVEIFREWAGARADKLRGGTFPSDIKARIASALASEDGNPTNEKTALCEEIGFHLTDIQRDAAFLVALTLFPERFTDEDIRSEVMNLLCHVPHHMEEARKAHDTLCDME